MNLKEMGENFRRERERQGLTIEDVVQRTKISKTNIESLEAGDMEGLPHPVYAKGFVRNYAKLLKLDPEEFADAMGREFVVQDNVAPELEGEEGVEPPVALESPGNGLKLLLLGLALLTIVAGGAAFMLFSGDSGDEAVPAPAVQQEQAAPEAATVPVVPAEEAAVEPAPAEAMPAEEVQSAPQAMLEPVQEEAAAVAESAPVEEVQVAATIVADDEADGGRQRVVVTATETCWVLALVDGGDDADSGVTVDVTLQPGQSKLLRFHRSLEVKLGNGGGVEVALNGAPYAFTAQSGQVKTLMFTAP